MPKFYNEEKLKELLLENRVPITDAVKRGEFYRQYFDWNTIFAEYESGLSLKDLCKKYNLSYDVVRKNLYRMGATKVKPLERKVKRFLIQLERSKNGVTSPFRNLAVNTWDSLSSQRDIESRIYENI